ncbi:MAG TPA: DNA repair protein RecO [Chroococcidiopsis sp.]
MSATYKATGINLKCSPIGESDRLLTVLTKEHGLIRAVAPGARKHQSTLRGRSGLFVVNQLLIVKGRSLDKIIQAESIENFVGLSQDLKKLTTGQYLAELVLCQALSDQPQDELFTLLTEGLRRVETLSHTVTLPCLIHTTYHLLLLAGLEPRVHVCCLSQEPLLPNFAVPQWQVGFSAEAGGTVKLSQSDRPVLKKTSTSRVGLESGNTDAESPSPIKRRVVEQAPPYVAAQATRRPDPLMMLNARELALFQSLAQPDLIQPDGTLALDPEALPAVPSDKLWLTIERILRHYAQYHFERPIRSATLIDTCFQPYPSCP